LSAALITGLGATPADLVAMASRAARVLTRSGAQAVVAVGQTGQPRAAPPAHPVLLRMVGANLAPYRGARRREAHDCDRRIGWSHRRTQSAHGTVSDRAFGHRRTLALDLVRGVHNIRRIVWQQPLTTKRDTPAFASGQNGTQLISGPPGQTMSRFQQEQVVTI
jgi:hypothetical protein